MFIDNWWICCSHLYERIECFTFQNIGNTQRRTQGGGGTRARAPPYEMRGPSDGGGPKARLRHCVPAGPKAGRKPVFVISDLLSFESVLFLFYLFIYFFPKMAPWK